MASSTPLRSVVGSWNLHDGKNSSNASSCGSGSSRLLQQQALWQQQRQQQRQQQGQTQVLGVPRLSSMGPAMQEWDLAPIVQPIAGDTSDVAVSVEHSALHMSVEHSTLLDKLEGLPEALNMAKDALVEQAVRMQAEMHEFMSQSEQRLTALLDSHRKSLELVRDCLETSHQREIVPEQKSAQQPLAPVNCIDQLSTTAVQSASLKAADQYAQLSQPDKAAEVQRTAASSDALQLRPVRNGPYETVEQRAAASDQPRSGNSSPRENNPVRREESTASAGLDPMPANTRFGIKDKLQVLCAAVIISNTLMLGVQIDVELKDAIAGRGSEHAWIKAVNVGFLIIFTLELLIRIIHEKQGFCVGAYRWWNLFDALMVLTAFTELMIENSRLNFTFFRMIRVVRMVRTMRILRVFRYCRDLRLMVSSLLLSFKSLTWALFLIFLLIYCCAIMFCQGVTAFLESDNGVEYVDQDGSLHEYYGSVPRAMYTLIMAISSGQDWADLIAPLTRTSPWHAAVFVIYQLTVLFGMLNVLTGVFVDRASELSHLDRDLIVEAEKFKVEHSKNALRNIFHEADADNSGFITWPEFRRYCQREDVQAYFETMDIPIEETQDLFHMFHQASNGGQGRVQIDDFIHGCLRMKGHAKNVDVLHVQSEIMDMKWRVTDIQRHVTAFLDRLADSVQAPIRPSYPLTTM